MRDCTGCGHALGVGRYCTNCGRPADATVVRGPAHDTVAGSADGTMEWRAATAERPGRPAPAPLLPASGAASAPPPPPPPPPPPARSSARFPLYADEVPATAADAGQQRRHAGPRTGRWLLPLVATATVLVVAATGLVLVLSGDDEAAPGRASSPTEDATPAGDPSDGELGASAHPPSSAPATAPGDVAGQASAEVPATAASSVDLEGNRIRYDAEMMLDGVAETAWRMPGDGTGEEIVFTLAAPATIDRVGLINGYAKSDGRGARQRDWYAGNRRIRVVEWIFDDGATVRQELDQTRDPQTIAVDPVTTDTVRLRLVSVSRPGRGPQRRDFTAISEITLVATPR